MQVLLNAVYENVIRYATYSSPLGDLLLATTEHGLCGLHFAQSRRQDCDSPRDPLLNRAVRQLDEYFAGERTAFDLPTDLVGGTDFQRSVWRAVSALPYGTTRSYGSIAQAVGRPVAVRAVGAAIGRNPVCIIIPCHRVVGAGGALRGYAGGMECKRFLLELERRCDDG